MELRARPSFAAVLLLGLALRNPVDGASAVAPPPPAPRTPQSQHGEIVGRVVSATGAALPGVAVTVSGPALLGCRSTDTTPAGTYRVARLPVGVYTVVFVLAGFANHERRMVRIDAGANAQIDARLDVARSGEATTVSQEGPFVDIRASSIATTVTRDWLDRLPSGLDPWATLQMVPGITIGAKTVEANTPGQGAAEAYALASRGWPIDVRTVTNLAEHASALDHGIDSLDEIQVERGAVDASVRNRGVAVNVITRSAGNRFRGSARYTLTDRDLQSDNLTPGLKAQGAGLGNPVHRIGEAGIELGGPVVRDKAWLFGSATRSVVDVGLIGFYTAACLNPDGSPVADAPYRAACMHADTTTIGTVNARLQYQWSPAHRSSIEWGKSDRRKPSRGASAYTRPESTTRQSSLSLAHPLELRHQFVVSDRLVLDGRYTFSDASYILDFQDPTLAGIQPAYDRYTLVNSRSGVQTESRRPTSEIQLAGDYSFRGFRGGDHSATFGIEVRDAPEKQWTRTGGGAVAVFDSRSGSPVSYQARIVRDGLVSLGSREYSAYFQDSYRRGRLSITGGIRFDRQDDEALEATIPANRVLPDPLPAVRFPGADSGVVYNDVSPRLGIVWDVTGRATTVVKATAARYRGIGNVSSAPLQPTRQTRLVYWWSDANHDGFVQPTELDFSRGAAATPSSNYDAANPGAVKSPATVDPRLTNDVTDELTLGFEHQLARHLTIRGAYVGREMHQVQATFPINADGSLISSETYDPVRWTPANCPAGAACPAVTYYQRSAPLPPWTALRNDGEYAWHHSVELVLHKRLADGWMLDASLEWSTAVRHFPRSTFDYTDPTNIEMWNGAAYSSLQPRWIAKVAGAARLPWGGSTSAFLSAREGLPFVRGVTSPNRGALGSTVVDIEPYGSERYPAVSQIDVRIERSFRTGRLEIVPALDVFNALNSNVVLGRNRIQNTPTANNVTEIQAPRIVHIGVKVSF